MKKDKLLALLFFAALLLLPNCADVQKEETKNESYSFISFKKVEFGSLDENSIFYSEPEEVDCLVTIIWERTKNQLHIYDDSYGIIDYEVVENSEENNEFILEAKRMTLEKINKEFATLDDHIYMEFNKNDSVAILQINDALSGTVYYMNLNYNQRTS